MAHGGAGHPSRTSQGRPPPPPQRDAQRCVRFVESPFFGGYCLSSCCLVIRRIDLRVEPGLRFGSHAARLTTCSSVTAISCGGSAVSLMQWECELRSARRNAVPAPHEFRSEGGHLSFCACGGFSRGGGRQDRRTVSVGASASTFSPVIATPAPTGRRVIRALILANLRASRRGQCEGLRSTLRPLWTSPCVAAASKPARGWSYFACGGRRPSLHFLCAGPI